ncbi:class I SAM-dependent methyltransferase [Anaerotignum sp. MSJ-24]|uniref:class I SAM-dependent methyltransferase n=1 Tax=Anaerotignum sp. MSJ-24 TaxID=2841521 RepID=UPI001C121E1F|nr:class I SAM-dependent methyltransferase [Anaerotignum sp. MSJ-24]MBU5463607.1 class I SAM-dependent methyltransferase [Anaerotignum sp. MSJ-24]
MENSVEKVIGDFWDNYSSEFDGEHDTENIDVWKKYLEEILGADKNKVVLDMGAGTGFLANMTAELGYTSIGVDISRKMLEYAVDHADKKKVSAAYMYGSILDLPFMDNTADYVINARVLWTLVEPDKAIKEWARVIKPGGSIFCFNRMKEDEGITVYKKDFYDNKEVDDKLVVQGAKMDELKNLMERNGLVNVRIEQLPDTYKDEALKDMDWYQPWFVLAADKPL